MDSSFMDGLLLDGCWLETTTTDASEFPNFSPSTSIPPFDPSSFMWSPTQDNTTAAPISSSTLSQVYYGQGLEDLSTLNNRRWWIGPSGGGLGSTVMERLVQAVKHIKDFSSDRGDSLIQLWVPVDRGERSLRSTSSLLSKKIQALLPRTWLVCLVEFSWGRSLSGLLM